MTVSQTVRVEVSPRPYEILIGNDLLSKTADFAKTSLEAQGFRWATALVVTDDNVRPHADVVLDSLKRDCNARLLSITPGEASKSPAVVQSIYDALVELPADRHTVVFAVGGGVVGDAAGFAAATYARGIPLVQVPTSLLAMVDSSVGGKTGINHPQGKNLIGAFHQPAGVLIDLDTLSTLPERDFRAGLAEVVKYGVILDVEFFAFLEDNAAAIRGRDPAALAHAVAQSCRLKADVVERDEFERSGIRAALNYGHTFGHALEALSSYQMLHGEAVSVGMVLASRLAERVGLIDSSVTMRQVELLREFELPTDDTHRFPIDDMIARMRLDKKAVAGEMRFILPNRLGEVSLRDDIAEADVRHTLSDRGARR